MDGDRLLNVTLDDKYTLAEGRVFISGVQALVRLPLMQKACDEAAGLNTAGFISGYRGSPLGGYDAALWQAARYLKANDILFKPGLNEDLAATAVWGTQELDFVPGRKVDGVFAIWYGKGPGVDRSADAIKHANFAGTHPNGGVLLVCGDDHPGKSSTLAHQSDHVLASFGVPVLYPATVQDFLDYGLYGIAMSRFAGTVVAFKTVNETVGATSTVAIDPARVSVVLPEDAPLPPGGVHIRPEYDPPGQDMRLVRYKLPRAQAFVRANRLDRITFGATAPNQLAIVTAGKAYLDVIAALRQLGIDQTRAETLGIGVYKVAMVWPLEPAGLTELASGCTELMFVEEKRPVMEDQAKTLLYGLADQPRITGKLDGAGTPMLPPDHQIDSMIVADAIADRLAALGLLDSEMRARAETLRGRLDRQLPDLSAGILRAPYFCSGCPHNTSTKVPDGSTAMAGIGCHGMVLMMDRNTVGLTHMGAEGVNWIGIAPFTETPHIFQNLGDGTYTHSGALAIRAAVQSGANMTYKILFNDAVAMTGGQPVEGGPTVDRIARQVLAEGVAKVAIVSDRPEQFQGLSDIPAEVRIHHRSELDAVQKDMRQIEGVTVIIYEQTCAAEKRRRRKRGQFPDPVKRAFINELVCEGCGDCSTQANCVSIHPRETEFGRKRMIDQSSCNKDYSCVEGFCPSFVTVHGGALRRAEAADISESVFARLPAPAEPTYDQAWNILIAGIGGTGVVTIGAVLGMAAHLEGKSASVFDMTGLSQKNGAVYSHLQISSDIDATPASGISAGGADLILGCDLVAAIAPAALGTAEPGATNAVVNATVTPTPSFQANADLKLDGGLLARGVADHIGADRTHLVEATAIARALTGDTIGANTFMIGYALQKGCLPLSVAAIERAIELNGVAVAFNLRALRLGRLAAAEPQAVAGMMPDAARAPAAQDLDSVIERRVAFLTDYQDADYAARYRRVVESARKAESSIGGESFAGAVARYAFKVMAYKDEYEVARLYTEGSFAARVAETFAGDYKLHVHLAPPLIAPRDPMTGRLQKREYGTWVLKLFKPLARLKGLRGTRFDPFGWTAERKAERQLRDQYLADIENLSRNLTAENRDLAVQIAEIPEQIRGFGHVKEQAMTAAAAERARLFDQIAAPTGDAKAA